MHQAWAWHVYTAMADACGGVLECGGGVVYGVHGGVERAVLFIARHQKDKCTPQKARIVML